MVLLLALVASQHKEINPLLVGTWQYVKMSISDQPGNGSGYKGVRMVVRKDGSYSIFLPDSDSPMAIGQIGKITGKNIDRTIASRSEFNGQFQPVYHQAGIWAIEGGRLITCFARDPEQQIRPTRFEALPGKNQVVEILERPSGASSSKK